jgi:hypothetical protein
MTGPISHPSGQPPGRAVVSAVAIESITAETTLRGIDLRSASARR